MLKYTLFPLSLVFTATFCFGLAVPSVVAPAAAFAEQTAKKTTVEQTANRAIPTKPTVRRTVIPQDLTKYPQNLLSYCSRSTGDKAMLTHEQQVIFSTDCVKNFLGAWRDFLPKLGDPGFTEVCPPDFIQNGGYDETGAKWSSSDQKKVLANAAAEKYPSRHTPAVILKYTDIRALPTSRRQFTKPPVPEDRLNFDLLQYSDIPIGMPVMITHISKDKKWVFIENNITDGWIPASDAVPVHLDKALPLYTGKLGVVTADKTVLSTRKKKPMATAHMGALLPMSSVTGAVYIPLRSRDGYARFVSTWSADRHFVQSFPMKMTQKNVARIGNVCMGQLYGWGNIDGLRDCSAMTRDIMLPFGIWLPRNSFRQKDVGEYIDLTGLSAADKKTLITSKGIPFASLIYMPGHITLYIGTRKKEPMVYHNTWRIALRDKESVIIGKSIVSSLMLGQEIKDADPEKRLIERAKGLVILNPVTTDQFNYK